MIITIAMIIIIAMIIPIKAHLDSSIVRRAASCKEAEPRIEPHHVVHLEAVPVHADQQGAVGVCVPPVGGQALHRGWHEGQLGGRGGHVDLVEVLPENFGLDVVQHPDSQEVFVVVPVKVSAVALVQEHLGVKLLLGNPTKGSLGDNTRSQLRLFSRLLPLSAPRNGSREAIMAALHLATSVFSWGDQLPDELLDVLVPIVGVEAVEEGEADSILVMKARLVVV